MSHDARPMDRQMQIADNLLKRWRVVKTEKNR